MTTRAPNQHVKSANGKWQSLTDAEILSLQLLERRHGTTAAARMVGVTVTTFEVIAAGRGVSPKVVERVRNNVERLRGDGAVST